MSLSTSGFYITLCDGWNDAVGDSLKQNFKSTLDLIDRVASYINKEISDADHLINEGITVLNTAKEPAMPSV